MATRTLLRSAGSKSRMQTTPDPTTVDADGLDAEQLSLEEQVVILRRQYDDMRQLTAGKEKDVESLQDKLKDLEKDSIRPNSEDSPLTRQIRTLENRLDKAMIKYNEAQSIRKTYEQIVKRLKEERIGFDNQLQAIERTLKAKEHDLEELMLMSHDANHAKEVAKGELAKLEGQIAEERKLREKELNERKSIVQAKKDMAHRLEKREKLRREIQMEAAGDLSEDGEKALKRSLVTNVFHHGMNEQRLEEEAERIMSFEDAFRKIKEATGVGDVNEVIQKFLTQEDTHNNLLQMTDEARSRIETLNEDKNMLKAKVEEIKYSGGGNFGSRTVVDQFETHLTTSNAKCERNRQKYERIAKILINVKAGIAHLSDKLEAIKVVEPFIPMTDETVVAVLQQCERKLMFVMNSVAEAEEVEAKRAAREAARKSHVESPRPMESELMDGSPTAFNVRIKLADKNEEQLSDEENDDDAEEDVPDRETMKRLAGMMLEKATKKTKRKRRVGSTVANAITSGSLAGPGSVSGGTTIRSNSGGRDSPSGLGDTGKFSSQTKGSRSVPKKLGLDTD